MDDDNNVAADGTAMDDDNNVTRDGTAMDDDNIIGNSGMVAQKGGFALALDISDVNLAFTASEQNLYQGNLYVSGAAAGGGLGGGKAESEFESESCIDLNVEGNVCITGFNVGGGSFNNQANMSSVNVTVQW